MILPLAYSGASLIAQSVKNLPEMQETWVWSLGQEDSLEKKMETHSSILAWRIPWTEEPGRLQSTRSQQSDTTERRNHSHHLLTHGCRGCGHIPPSVMASRNDGHQAIRRQTSVASLQVSKWRWQSAQMLGTSLWNSPCEASVSCPRHLMMPLFLAEVSFMWIS